MARKRGQYQRRKERENKITGVVCFFVLVIFIPLMLTYGIIDNGSRVYQINNDSLHEYTGKYTYRLHKGYNRRSRSKYIFTLDNGDTVVIPKRYCKNDEILGECQELTIYYDTNPINANGHSAVSITTTDGQVEILDRDLSYGLRVANVWICSVSLVISVALAIFIVILFYHIDWKRRLHVWHKERKRKKSKQKMLGETNV